MIKIFETIIKNRKQNGDMEQILHHQAPHRHDNKKQTWHNLLSKKQSIRRGTRHMVWFKDKLKKKDKQLEHSLICSSLFKLQKHFSKKKIQKHQVLGVNNTIFVFEYNFHIHSKKKIKWLHLHTFNQTTCICLDIFVYSLYLKLVTRKFCIYITR